MSLTKTERMALAVLKARINPRDAGHASDVIPKAAQPYIDTWILPLIEYLEGGDRRQSDVDMIRKDYGTMVARAAAVQAAGAIRARSAAIASEGSASSN